MQQLQVSRSFLKFIANSDCALSDFLYRMIQHKQSGYPVVNLVFDTSAVNYLTWRTDGTISYLPAGKELKYNDSGDWSREGRQSGRPSKVLRKILTPRAQKLFKDKDFEQFALQYQASGQESEYHFHIHDRKMIPDIYDMDLTEDCGSSLAGSCMNGDGHLLDLYACCPHLRIIAMYDRDNRLAGRALLWSLPNGKLLMDRVYVAKESLYELFLAFAERNKFTRKVNYKSYSDKENFTDDNGETTYAATFKIFTDTDFDRYPYIDTFTYGGDGFISNCASNTYYEYTNTDGTRDGDNRVECAHTNDMIHEDDARYIDRGRYRDSYIHHDIAIRDVDGNWWWEEDGDLVEVGGKYYPTDHSDIVYIEDKDEHYHIDDCVTDFNGDWILLDESYRVNGEYYHEDLVEKM